MKKLLNLNLRNSLAKNCGRNLIKIPFKTIRSINAIYSDPVRNDRSSQITEEIVNF